ncbi:hypothetical protein QBC44DRAFT_399811 [Cladorrhinum sp. PSN332]|nr:hypothetical protein QBC44DRAFT_399811 [Cladorrhinum sp. PSN332]
MPTETYTLSTPLPPGILPSRAVSLLHDASNLINLSPYVISSRKIITSDSYTPKSNDPKVQLWKVTDKVSILPFGLWDSSVEVPLEFVNKGDGVEVSKFPPLMGLVIRERWAVDEKEVRLDVALEGGKVVLMGVGKMMRGNHEGYVRGFGGLMESAQGKPR